MHYPTRTAKAGTGSGRFLLKAETQPTKNSASILFGLNLYSNYMF